MSGWEVVLSAVVGVAVGGLSAGLGVGGGIIMVPYMALALGVSQHVAEGTSLLVIVPTSIAGVAVHARSGFVDFRTALALAMTGMVGALLGARLALTLDGDALQTYFGVVVVVTGVDLLRRGLAERNERQAA